MKIAVPQLYSAILERIRAKISENELNQAQIGEALGIKQSAVSYLLKGKTKINLEQFLILSNLLGEPPHKILADADSSLVTDRPMPKEVEEVMLRSALHVLCYVAACRPVKAVQIAHELLPLDNVKQALRELAATGVLTAKGEVYVQTEPHVSFKPAAKAGHERRYRLHQEVHRLCQQLILRHYDNKEYLSKRFNYFMVGLFTDAQIRAIEEPLWRAYEKLRAANRENMAKSYAEDSGKFSLWQAHMMLMTPTDDK